MSKAAGRRATRSRRGVAAMEFALCVPFAFLLLASVVDGGRLVTSQHALARATRDAARVGAIVTEPPPATGALIETEAAAAAARSMTAAGYAADQFSVVADWAAEDGVAWITVQVTADFEPFFGGLSPFQGPLRDDFSMLSQEQ